MCGIAGLLYFERERAADPMLLQRMTDVITHRGPDDQGHEAIGPVGLGSRRLSIVGLPDGHMPMSTEDGRIWVVYNGEIYNHPYLRRQLEDKGHRYRTGSDTESILHAYREWGEGFAERLQGMFAIALWDDERQTLILVRDRLGIKPLYYQQDAQALRFGSEIKSLLCDPAVPRNISTQALNFYMAYLSPPAPHTMFAGIYALRPGEMLIAREGQTTQRMYWEPQLGMHALSEFDLKTVQDQLVHRFQRIVGEHLLADVPVGAFLSGGIDSSIIVAMMYQELGPGFPTFSIGFEGQELFDETRYARQIAERYATDHHEQRLSSQDLLKALDDITWQLDEPLADSSCLPVYYVSRLASEHVKVVLSGDGSDEIFAGYRKYQGEFFYGWMRWLPDAAQRWMADRALANLPESRGSHWMDMLRQVKKFSRGMHPEPFERHLRWTMHFEDQAREALFTPETLDGLAIEEARDFRKQLFDQAPHWDTLNRMLWVDLRHNLPADMLTKVDRMSMLHSLEVRVPFLDHELVEFAFSLPSSVKLRGKSTKWLLKKAFSNYLPYDLIHRRKHGFDVPVGEWFKHELRDVIEEVTSERVVRDRGLFNPGFVKQLWEDHREERRDYNNQLWMLLSLELWQRQYLDAAPGEVKSRPTAAGSP